MHCKEATPTCCVHGGTSYLSSLIHQTHVTIDKLQSLLHLGFVIGLFSRPVSDRPRCRCPSRTKVSHIVTSPFHSSSRSGLQVCGFLTWGPWLFDGGQICIVSSLSHPRPLSEGGPSVPMSEDILLAQLAERLPLTAVPTVMSLPM